MTAAWQHLDLDWYTENKKKRSTCVLVLGHQFSEKKDWKEGKNKNRKKENVVRSKPVLWNC